MVAANDAGTVYFATVVNDKAAAAKLPPYTFEVSYREKH
jgi:hypothetical protein